MLYRYSGFGAGGAPAAGQIEAPARAIAMSRLRGRGILPETVWPVVQWNLELSWGRSGARLSLRQLAVLLGQLGMLIRGGVPVLQSLQVLAGHYRGRLAAMLGTAARAVEGGQPLSRALGSLGGLVPPVAVHVLSVSEVAGELESGLDLLTRQFDAEDQIARKVRSALVYPVIVVLMTVALAVFMLTFIIPRYATLFQDLHAELPGPTLALLAVAGAVWRWGWLMGLLALALAAAVVVGLRRSEAVRLRLHRLALRPPVVGPLIRQREAGRYCRVLATLLKSGIPVMGAADAAAESVQNAWLAHRLARVPQEIALGISLGRAVRHSEVLSPVMAELLTVGETIGATDETLMRIATFAEQDVDQTVQRLTALLEPALVLILGGVVLAVVYPLILPLFDIYTKIN